MIKFYFFVALASSLALGGYAAPVISSEKEPLVKTNAAIAMFGSGCFWCSEAVFQRVPGVITVKPGYSGGITKSPTYQQVCSGITEHAEVVQISFDPQKVSYEKLLDTFWQSHDPTTLNRQGADVGTQYRSVIFYFDEAQRVAAEKSRADLEKSGAYQVPIVTRIEPAREFYPAEADHVDYYNRNKSAPYCRLIITPKLEKLNRNKTP